MMTSRITRVVAVVLAQAALVVVAVWAPLSARATGQEVVLRVAAYDPIDPFRGAYVALDYPDLYPAGEDRGDGDVYITLVEKDGLWVRDAYATERPADGPYLAYTDAFPDARAGWLAEDGPASAAIRGTPADPRAPYVVSLRPEAKLACDFVERETGLALERRAREHLALGPEPHAYRRIRRDGDVSVLAVKEWRVAFVETGPRALESARCLL